LEGKQNYYCEGGQECGFTIWKSNNFYVGEITADNVRQLLSADGKTSLRAKNKEGKVYTAEYQLDDTGQYVNFKRLAEEKISLGKCPRCGKDIYEGKNNFYCEGGQSCNFTIWKHTKRPEVTVSVKNVRELLSTGKTTISAKQLNGTAVKKTYSSKIRKSTLILYSVMNKIPHWGITGGDKSDLCSGN
jgi:DNA topoisomerase-3